MRAARLLTVCAAASVIVLSVSVPARAGCGCQKPPPPLAQIRPAFASPGEDHDRLVVTVRGIVENQGLPVPGATPPFTLDIVTVLPDGSSGPVASTTIQWSPECAVGAPSGGSSGSNDDDDSSGSNACG